MNTVGKFITKYLVIWVAIAAIVAYLYPTIFIIFKPYNEYLFSITMLGIGMVLNTEDFVNIVKKFHLVILGTLAQFLIMPFSGWLVGNILSLENNLRLGFIMTGAVPGAMASNIISYLAKADVAYSISLTTTSTFLSPILTPLFIYIFAGSFVEIKFFSMMLSIIKMVIVPIFLGIYIKKFFRTKIDSFVEIFPAISSLFIAFICGLVVALNKDYLKNTSGLLLLGVVILNFLGLSLGYFAGYVYKFDTKRKRTLAIEVGMQNAGLGAVLSLKHFSPEVAIPSALFATFCVITASVLAKIWSKNGTN